MKRLHMLILIFVYVCLSVTTAFAGKEPDHRPDAWAKPIAISGLPNLHKVSDALYRSAQPEKSGMDNLKHLGVKTIVCLRAFHSDKDIIEGKGFNYESISMKTWHPEKEDVVKFLKIVTDPTKTPVLVHCQHGADRTGTMCAIYRVAVEGWTKEAAIKEMTEGGYNFHSVWVNLPPWIRDLDITDIKKQAGISSENPISN
jgi:protein tyrosine phosphatase (PTP) superfamily phosphohydrolase (DUF442 family)